MATVTIEVGDRVPLFIDSTDDIDYDLFYQEIDGDIIDITSYNFEWSFEIGGITIVASTGNGRLTTVDAEGKITLHLDADTDDGDGTLPQGLGEHRLRVIDPVIKTLMRGALTNDT